MLHNRNMPVTADTLRQQFDYSTWASQRLLEEANKLPAEELARDFSTADRSVVETLAHVFAADRVWLARVQGTPRASFIEDRDRELATLNKEWPEIQQSWKQLLAGMSDQDIQKVVEFKDLKGNPNQQPLWKIVMHLVNHGTHHRGQVSGFLRAMGHTPPAIDLMVYYRTH